MKRKLRWSASSNRCALCLELADLSKSHIIPHFHWRRARNGSQNERLKIYSLDPADPVLVANDEKEPMLCAKCEAKLNKWETPAASVWDRITTAAVQHIGEGKKEQFFSVGCAEYAPVKLYFMSLLWRTGVSNRPFFRLMRLGTHEKVLRKMLMAETPGKPTEYPCMLMVPTISGEWRDGWMLPPERFALTPSDSDLEQVIDARLAIRMVINGIVFVFGLPSFTGPVDFSQIALNESGQMKVFVRKVGDLPYLTDRLVRMIDAGNRRERPLSPND